MARTLTDWKEWIQQDPRAAAQAVHTRAAALRPGQRAALFAWEADAETLATAMATAHQSGAPLGGVPFAVKDLFHTAGVPTRAGSAFLAEVLPTPQSDGAFVAALKAAGGTLASKTHLHEFAYGLTGENAHFGDVEHPSLPGHTSGGSSSGSAAAVAAGIVPLALGTDTGGSIRVPSAFCGIYGFRLTPHHRWIADGFPLAPSFDTAGWFTANAPDMATVMGALIGTPRRVERAPIGCYLDFEQLGASAEPATKTAYETNAHRLTARADESTAQHLAHVFTDVVDAYAVLQSTEAYAVHSAWLDSHRARYEPGVWSRIDRGRRWTPQQNESAHAKWTSVRLAWTQFFLTYDFLVLPATPFSALAKAECTLENRNRLLALTAPASLGGLPVLTVPIPLGDGRSSGLQIIVNNPTSPVLPWVLSQL